MIKTYNDVWWFDYQGVGWGHFPHTEEQWNFLLTNKDKYPDQKFLNYILSFRDNEIERLLILKKFLTESNKRYRTGKEQSTVSDTVYDRLLKELEELENKYSDYKDSQSVTQIVGGLY